MRKYVRVCSVGALAIVVVGCIVIWRLFGSEEDSLTDNSNHDSHVTELTLKSLEDKIPGLADLAMKRRIQVSVARMRRLEAKMRSRDFYEEAARQLGRYCQSVSTRINDDNIGDVIYPEVIRQLKPIYGYISPDGARVTCGGGFYPLGYFLRRADAESTDESCCWVISIYNEDGQDRLTTIRLNKQEMIPKDQFVRDTIAEFDKRIMEYPNATFWARAKVMFLLEFDEPQSALRECRKACETIPDYWWLRVTLAFMQTAMDSGGQPAKELEHWVGTHPSFSNYFYLSYYYEKEGNIQAACESILNALKCPLTTSRTDSYNIYYLAYNMLAYAYENQRQNVAIAVCDAMEDPEREAERATSARDRYIDFAAIKKDILSEDSQGPSKWTRIRPRPFNPYQASGTNAVRALRIGRHTFP